MQINIYRSVELYDSKISIDCSSPDYTGVRKYIEGVFTFEAGRDGVYDSGKVEDFMVNYLSDFILNIQSIQHIQGGGTVPLVAESLALAYKYVENYIRAAQVILMLKAWSDDGYIIEMSKE